MCEYCKQEDCPDKWGLYHCNVDQNKEKKARPGKSIKIIRTTEGAIRTDLVGKQHNDSRVDANR